MSFAPHAFYSFAIYILFIDVDLDEFQVGVWKDCLQIQDPSLLRLASLLPKVVLSAKAQTTTLHYAYAWNRWKTWSKSKIGVAYLPAQPMCVALYLRDLLESAQTSSPIDTAIYSIRWGYSMAGLPSLTDHPIVKSTYEGCKIILAKPRQPKEPIQPHMLQQLVDMHGHSTASPADLRLLFIVLVGYSGFLRISEILAIQLKHIEIVSHGMSIFVPRRKNDQFRSGNTIHIARSGKSTCPVAITERLFQMLPDNSDSCNPVVRRIKYGKGGRSFHESRGISYTTAKDLTKLGYIF